MPALIAGLAGRVLASTGGKHLTEDYFVDIGAFELGAGHGSLQGNAAESRGRNAGQRSIERAHWRTRA